MKTSFFESFDNKVLSFDKLILYQEKIKKMKPYLIFFTARSGSSYLADLLGKTGLAGRPGEYFNPAIMPRTLSAIKKNHGVSIESITDYLLWLIENRRTKNGAFGLKATHPHYSPFIETGLDRLFFSDFELFYLHRNNILKQAISLYVMSETTLAHKNKEISPDIISRAQSLPYNGEKICKWISHLWTQEKRLEMYFKTLGRDVTSIEYQQFAERPEETMRVILRGVGAASDHVTVNSDFKKVGSGRNDYFASEFFKDEEGLAFLRESGIPSGRLEGA